MAPNSSTPNTRERILTFLQENRSTTVSALSRAWGLTTADIRYHLTTLADEGLVEVIARDAGQPAARGRPIQHYRLAVHSSPDNLPALASALLGSLLEQIPPAEQDLILRALAARLAPAEPEIDADSTGTRPAISATLRFSQAVAYLNQHAYRARWEASAGGPRILLRNCPYAAILPDHPHLCRVDRYLLEQLLHLPLNQTARMNLATGKPPVCIFSIQ